MGTKTQTPSLTAPTNQSSARHVDVDIVAIVGAKSSADIGTDERRTTTPNKESAGSTIAIIEPDLGPACAPTPPAGIIAPIDPSINVSTASNGYHSLNGCDMGASNSVCSTRGRPHKRGSMGDGFITNVIARRRTLFSTSKKEGRGKADHSSISPVTADSNPPTPCVNDYSTTSSSIIALENDTVVTEVAEPLPSQMEAGLEFEDKEDFCSVSSDSLEDYESAASGKDECWFGESSKAGGHFGATGDQHPFAPTNHYISDNSIQEWTSHSPSERLDYPQPIPDNRLQMLINASLSGPLKTHPVSPFSPKQPHTKDATVAWNSFFSSPTTSGPPLQNIYDSPSSRDSTTPKSLPTTSSRASLRTQKLLQSMRRIIDMNAAASDFYSAGEYNSALDSLREAEECRAALVNLLEERSCSSVKEKKPHISSPRAVVQHICEADSALFPAKKTVRSNFSSFARSEEPLGNSCLETISMDSSKPFAPRTSYIYQRMDFDEGMHSFSGTQKIDSRSFWLARPGQREAETKHELYEISPSVEATLIFNVGQVHRRRGEFDSAAKLYDRSLEILKTICATKQKGFIGGQFNLVVDPLIIPLMHNIGQLQYRRGDLATSMNTYTSVLKHAQIIYGPRHQHAASALNCLGVLHYHANSSESDDADIDSESVKSKRKDDDNSSTQKAMELFRQALSIRIDRLGVDHVDVATTLNNIGRIHVQRDEFDDALRYYEDALRIRRDRLGTNSLDYAATAFNAGQSLHQKGELDRAAELYREFLRVALMKFGHSHRDVAVVLSGIAQIHQEKRDYDKALELYEESLCAGRAALGEYHSEIAMLLNRMGNFHFERERLDDALRCYRRGLRIEKRVLPLDHPNIIVTLSNLGEIHRQRSEWDDAAKMYCDALEILRKKHGENNDHLDVASTLNTIGLIHDQRGDTCLSLRYLQDALLMRRRLLGDDHLDVSATLVYVGTILYRKSIFSVALELFSESLRIRRAALGKDHRDVAFALYNIALVYQQRGCHEQAIEYYSETLRVEKLVLGERHRDVSMTLFKLGEVKKAAGDLDEALRCFQSSLSIERSLSEAAVVSASVSCEAGGQQQQQHTASDPAAMARTLNEIGNIHLARGDVAPMMEAFNESSRLYRSAGLSPNNVVVSGHLYALECSCPEAAPAA